MFSSNTLALIAGAVLVFWAVGAYNRLVRLRTEVTRAFAPIAQQLQARHALLLRWAEAVRPVLEGATQPVDAMLAAAEQLLVAVERAGQRPTAPRTMASLRMAEDTLVAARERLVADLPAHVHQQQHLSGASLGLAGYSDELAAAGTTLAFARSQFNATVDTYNEAVLQFPTVLIASLFGFRPAGPL
jgi:LemA protein